MRRFVPAAAVDGNYFLSDRFRRDILDPVDPVHPVDIVDIVDIADNHDMIEPGHRQRKAAPDSAAVTGAWSNTRVTAVSAPSRA